MTLGKFQHGLLDRKCLLMSRNAIFFKWEQRKLKYDYEMSGVKLESVQYVKDLGVTIALYLKFSQQCKDAAGKGNRMLDFIIFSFKNKDIILPLYNSLVRPHLEYVVQFWSPYLV